MSVFFHPFTFFHDDAYSLGLVSLLKVISIVDTFLVLLSPSPRGLSHLIGGIMLDANKQLAETAVIPELMNRVRELEDCPNSLLTPKYIFVFDQQLPDVCKPAILWDTTNMIFLGCCVFCDPWFVKDFSI